MEAADSRHHVSRSVLNGCWRLFLVRPNVLALNWASTTVQTLAFLLGFLVLCSVLLYLFRRVTAKFAELQALEGLQSPPAGGIGRVALPVTFVLVVLYLPVSTLAIRVLTWSEDLWAVPNPYANVTTTPVVIPPLGPMNEFRDPLDFCWTTTMRKDQINWAPALVSLALILTAMVRPAFGRD
jgi:hypothetical protein